MKIYKKVNDNTFVEYENIDEYASTSYGGFIIFIIGIILIGISILLSILGI